MYKFTGSLHVLYAGEVKRVNIAFTLPKRFKYIHTKDHFSTKFFYLSISLIDKWDIHKLRLSSKLPAFSPSRRFVLVGPCQCTSLSSFPIMAGFPSQVNTSGPSYQDRVIRTISHTLWMILSHTLWMILKRPWQDLVDPLILFYYWIRSFWVDPKTCNISNI